MKLIMIASFAQIALAQTQSIAVTATVPQATQPPTTSTVVVESPIPVEESPSPVVESPIPVEGTPIALPVEANEPSRAPIPPPEISRPEITIITPPRPVVTANPNVPNVHKHQLAITKMEQHQILQVPLNNH
jgi:hypothetical protein